LNTVGIYVHIPFCASRCNYCDFCSTANRRDLIPAYRDALLKHIREAAGGIAQSVCDTVYFGGGTPSWFGTKSLIRIFEEMKRKFRVLKTAEVTLEANPDSVELKNLRKLRSAGFNRISIGAQSANDAILKFIGRRHRFEDVVRAVSDARKAGFDNVSLDLIYGLPAQTRDDWVDTLTRVIELEPDHISCYGLKVEPGTPLWEYRDSPMIPDDDLQADMYLYAVNTLAAHDYNQYEISNFCRPGKASKHNLKYWQLGDYLGLGASAASNIGDRRYTCVEDVEEYIRRVNSGEPLCGPVEIVDQYERASEYLMLGLRTTRGISEDEYAAIYRGGFGPLEELLKDYSVRGLARFRDGRWSFTPPGFLLSNRLIGELLDAQTECKFHIGTPWREKDYFSTLF
jgi:oxygen-independent coproporphyrinogen-3 oxidase